MAIDDKPTSAWNERDLDELCEERRRETQSLEFKRELDLSSDEGKLKAEREAIGMAMGGGGHILYGIEEATLPDGGEAASALRPLLDGGLYERLEAMLDARGQPRLLFTLHEIRSARGGFYLVLEISGRRRPHQGSDGLYYGRRGTRVRQMEEAEVAEAYRDRIFREQRENRLLSEDGDPGALAGNVVERLHHGLHPGELVLREGGGEPPGWMSVMVMADPLRDLLDPVRDRDRFDSIDIPDRWDGDHYPLQYFSLRQKSDGLHGQLPPDEAFPPGYLVSMYRDGLMEYGTTLEPALRHEDPAENRIIFSASHTFQVHDYLQAFAVVLGELGYEGRVKAQVRFDHTRGVMLGVERGRDLPNLHPIEEESIQGTLWRLEQPQLAESAGRITKDVMDRVFLAAGVSGGCWFISEAGELLER